MNRKQVRLDDLIQSGREDAPPTGAKSRALTALGIGAGAVSIGVTGIASAAGGTAAKGALLAKLSVLAISVGVIGTVTFANRAMFVHRNPVSSAKAISTNAATSTTTVPPTEVAVAAQPLPAVADLPPQTTQAASLPISTVRPAVFAKPREPRVIVAPLVAASIDDEVRLLGAAQRAINEGKATEAERLLAEYNQTIHQPKLRLEASMIEIDEKILSGRKAEALQQAKQVLAADPNSPQAVRLRRMIESLEQ